MQEKKLYRSQKGRIIFGVCQGLADYFNIDPTLVRVIFIILALWNGLGIILYIVGAIAIPEVPISIKEEVEEKKKDHTKEKPVAEKVTVKEMEIQKNGFTNQQLFGIIVLVIGIIFLFQIFLPAFSFDKLWPIILIIIGLYIATRQNRKD